MKRILKSIFYSLFRLSFLKQIKNVYTPPEWLHNHLRFKGEFLVNTKELKSFLLYNNAFSLETRLFWTGLENNSWEYMSRKIWISLCKQSDTILDIGANTGIYSLLAKVYNPHSKIIAFEPQPNIYEVLQKNIEINNFDIQIENTALSNYKGEAKFYNYGIGTFLTNNTTAGSLNKDWRPKNQSHIIVQVNQLLNYIEETDIMSIDLIKIDVETSEYEVLNGYGHYLYLHEAIIILEIQNVDIGKKIKSLLHFIFIHGN